jgi:hypothetical protein
MKPLPRRSSCDFVGRTREHGSSAEQEDGAPLEDAECRAEWRKRGNWTSIEGRIAVAARGAALAASIDRSRGWNAVGSVSCLSGRDFSYGAKVESSGTCEHQPRSASASASATVSATLASALHATFFPSTKGTIPSQSRAKVNVATAANKIANTIHRCLSLNAVAISLHTALEPSAFNAAVVSNSLQLTLTFHHP